MATASKPKAKAAPSPLYVYSTLTSDVKYVNHSEGGADLPLPIGDGVVIRGGAGVMNDRIVTPRGVATGVTEAQIEYLRANKVFQLHEKNGFIVVHDALVNPDDIAAGMEGRDLSSPLTPNDLGDDEQATTGAATRRS